MRIPVFISCPTTLRPSQEAAKTLILAELKKHHLEPRQLGKSDYPTELPLREVYGIAKHCSGGIILGFEQFRTDSGIRKFGTAGEKTMTTQTLVPTEWNNLEAGILYALQVPILVMKEEGISGGVFDYGVTQYFVHKMPQTRADMTLMSEVFLKWGSSVRSHYYA